MSAQGLESGPREVEYRDLVIVGGGPAGATTALALHARAPELIDDALILDRAEFPRDKTCAGGLIPQSLALLRSLGLGLEVPYARVDRAVIEAGGAAIAVAAPGCCFVVRRREFDAMLLDAARERGAEVREGVSLRCASREGDRVRLETTAGTILARAVVGADGSGSRVRRELVSDAEGPLARAAMADVPIDGPCPTDYYFDFRAALRRELDGYEWSFPCWIDDRPHWNVGVYSLDRAARGGDIRRLLAARCGGNAVRERAFPIRLFSPDAAFSADRVLLVGDAAGVDPLLGEGISYAIEYGILAAGFLDSALRVGDFRFAGYGDAVRTSAVGRKLRWLRSGAKLFYGSRRNLWFRLARLNGRVQRVGMDWYNGVGLLGQPAPEFGRQWS